MIWWYNGDRGGGGVYHLYIHNLIFAHHMQREMVSREESSNACLSICILLATYLIEATTDVIVGVVDDEIE